MFWRIFLKKCSTVSCNYNFFLGFSLQKSVSSVWIFIYSLCPPPRCDPARQGRVRPPVLQPHELQLPTALRVALEEPAPVLHDRGGGEKVFFLLTCTSCLLPAGHSILHALARNFTAGLQVAVKFVCDNCDKFLAFLTDLSECYTLFYLLIIFNMTFRSIVCNCDSYLWYFRYFPSCTPSMRTRRQRRNSKSPVLSPWCRTATVSVSPTARRVNVVMFHSPVLEFLDVYWHYNIALHHVKTDYDLDTHSVFDRFRTHAEVWHVHGGEVASHSSFRAGRNWQRKLLHHEIQGTT